MTNKEIYEIVKNAVDSNGIELSQKEKERIEIIQNPPSFYSFSPSEIDVKSQNYDGENAR